MDVRPQPPARSVLSQAREKAISEQDREDIVLLTRGWGWQRIRYRRKVGKRKENPKLG